MKNTKTAAIKKAPTLEQVAAIIMLTFHQNTGRKKGKPGMLEVYWSPVDAIATMPEPGSTYTSPGLTATTADPIVMVDAVDGGFIDMINDLSKGSQLKYSSEGDLSSPTDKVMLTCKVNGFDAELVERFRDMKGVPGSLIVKDNTCPVDTYIVLGCKCNPLFLKFDFDSDTVGGTAGKRFDLSFEGNCAPYFWTGTTLPLKTPTA